MNYELEQFRRDLERAEMIETTKEYIAQLECLNEEIEISIIRSKKILRNEN